MRSTLIASAYDQEIGIIHGDTTADNVFVCSSGYRIIDWQRPMRGPRAIDRVAFLHSLGLNPSKHVDHGTIGIFYSLGIWWCTQCQIHWITEGNYDRRIANLASEILRLEQ